MLASVSVHTTASKPCSLDVPFQPSAQLSRPSQEYRGSALVAIETTLASSLLTVFLNLLHHSLLSWGQNDHFFN